MSELSIPALKAQINAQINTNGLKGINGASLNQNLIDTIDSIIGLIPVVPAPDYKEYVAVLTQEASNPPVAVVLSNTFGATPEWFRNQAGSYYMTLGGAFPSEKTIVLQNTTGIDSKSNVFAYREDDNTIYYETTNGTTYADGRFYGEHSIVVRVYN